MSDLIFKKSVQKLECSKDYEIRVEQKKRKVMYFSFFYLFQLYTFLVAVVHMESALANK